MNFRYCGQTANHALNMHQRIPQAGLSAYQKANENPSVDGSVAKALSTLSPEKQGLYKQYGSELVDAGEQLSGDYAYRPKWVEPTPLHTLNAQTSAKAQQVTLQTERERDALAKNMIKVRSFQFHGAEEKNDLLMKAGVPGVTTALGIVYYDLRPPVELLYPVNVPLRNSLARVSRINDGWGTAAHWMATRNVGFNAIEAEEGKRVGYSVPDNNNYTATYKEIGVERAVTFTAQPAGEGLADNVADEHLRGLHSLMLGEEGMILGGNSGTGAGNNGYVLGTAPTPTLTQAAGSTAFTTANTIYVYLVTIAPMGIPNNNWYGYGPSPTVAGGGLTPVITRNNADGSTTTLNGGTSQISAVASAAISVNGNQMTATAVPAGSTIPGVNGAAGYAWYVGTAAGIGNAYLYAITTQPTVVITAAASNANQPANAAGLNTDHSFNPLDFDGLQTYATAGGGYFVSQFGQGPTSSSSLTPLKMGGAVVEIENALEYFWSTYQAVPSKIWCGFQARQTLDFAMRWGGSNGQPFWVNLAPTATGGMHGGFTFDAYMSKWGSPTGNGNLLPILHHPMLPPGSILFDIEDNPYPHDRLPYTRAMLVQRDYYSVEWPVTTRSWTFGTYTHEVLQHMVPWLTGQITNIGLFVGN